MQQPTPLDALLRWLAQLEYNAVRRIETPTLLSQVARADGRALRGFLIADDLCMTRQRAFFRIVDTCATPIAVADVAEQYDLKALQDRYRELQDDWKMARRRVAS